jgi:hypothetical protein
MFICTLCCNVSYYPTVNFFVLFLHRNKTRKLSHVIGRLLQFAGFIMSDTVLFVVLDVYDNCPIREKE